MRESRYFKDAVLNIHVTFFHFLRTEQWRLGCVHVLRWLTFSTDDFCRLGQHAAELRGGDAANRRSHKPVTYVRGRAEDLLFVTW